MNEEPEVKPVEPKTSEQPAEEAAKAPAKVERPKVVTPTYWSTWAIRSK
jgi:hypothetical protein